MARFVGEFGVHGNVAVVALLTPVLRDTRGRWTLDYVRLRFAAHLL